MRYEVTNHDYACPGMERLRNRDEFILIVYPTPDMSDDALMAEILDDVGSVVRDDGFDYDACRSALADYFDTVTLSRIIAYSTTPDEDDGDEGACLFVYVREVADAPTLQERRTAFAAAIAPLRVAAPTESASPPVEGVRVSLWLGPCYVADAIAFDSGMVRLIYRANEKTREDDTIRTWWMSNDFDTVEALRSELGL